MGTLYDHSAVVTYFWVFRRICLYENRKIVMNAFVRNRVFGWFSPFSTRICPVLELYWKNQNRHFRSAWSFWTDLWNKLSIVLIRPVVFCRRTIDGICSECGSPIAQYWAPDHRSSFISQFWEHDHYDAGMVCAESTWFRSWSLRSTSVENSRKMLWMMKFTLLSAPSSEWKKRVKNSANSAQIA